MASTIQLAGIGIAVLGLAWLLILERDRLKALWERITDGDEGAVYDDLGPVESGRKEHEW